MCSSACCLGTLWCMLSIQKNCKNMLCLPVRSFTSSSDSTDMIEASDVMCGSTFAGLATASGCPGCRPRIAGASVDLSFDMPEQRRTSPMTVRNKHACES